MKKSDKNKKNREKRKIFFFTPNAALLQFFSYNSETG